MAALERVSMLALPAPRPASQDRERRGVEAECAARPDEAVRSRCCGRRSRRRRRRRAAQPERRSRDGAGATKRSLGCASMTTHVHEREAESTANAADSSRCSNRASSDERCGRCGPREDEPGAVEQLDRRRDREHQCEPRRVRMRSRAGGAATRRRSPHRRAASASNAVRRRSPSSNSAAEARRAAALVSAASTAGSSSRFARTSSQTERQRRTRQRDDANDHERSTSAMCGTS